MSRTETSDVPSLSSSEQLGRLEQLGERCVAVVARVERRLVADLLADRADARPAVLALGGLDRVAQQADELGVLLELARSARAAAPGGASRARRRRRCRRPPAAGAELVEEEEARARVDERLGRLPLAEAVDRGALARRCITSGVKSASEETMPNASGRSVYSRSSASMTIAMSLAFLPLRVVELLHRPDGVLVQQLFPAAQPLLLPVAVGAPDARLAEGRELVQDEVDLGCRRVVGVDQQRDARRPVDPWRRSRAQPTSRQASVSPPRSGLSSASPKGRALGQRPGLASQASRAPVLRGMP